MCLPRRILDMPKGLAVSDMCKHIISQKGFDSSTLLSILHPKMVAVAYPSVLMYEKNIKLAVQNIYLCQVIHTAF